MKYLEKSGLIRSPVLDFGSGHGEDAKWLRSKGYQVREYDPNFDGVSEMPDGKYNTVLCTYVLNVLPKNQEAKIVKQVMARLRPNGDAFFAVRGDVKKAGKTNRGYQRPVKMNAEIVAKPSGSPIFALSKATSTRKTNPAHGESPSTLIREGQTLYGDGIAQEFDGRVRKYDLRPISPRVQQILLEYLEADRAEDEIRPTSKKADELIRVEKAKSEYQKRKLELRYEFQQLAPKRILERDMEIARMRALSDQERAREIKEAEKAETRRYRALIKIKANFDIPSTANNWTPKKKSKDVQDMENFWRQEIDELNDKIDLLWLLRPDAYYPEVKDTGSQLRLFNPPTLVNDDLDDEETDQEQLDIEGYNRTAYQELYFEFGDDEADDVNVKSHLGMIGLLMNALMSIDLEIQVGRDPETGRPIGDFAKKLLQRDRDEYQELLEFHSAKPVGLPGL